MSDRSHGAPSDDASSGSDAFRLVGNEIRTDILRALGDARVEQGHKPVFSFSELRDRTETDAGSSKFNYHLQELVGQYVERVEDGYQMRAEGRALYQTLRAGTFDSRESTLTVDADFDCYYCGTGVEATVDEGTVTVECPGCDYLYGIAGAPPGAIEDDTVALEQVGAFYHHRHLGFARGVCVTCGTEPTIERVSPADVPFADGDRQELYVYRSCENCGDQRHLSLGTYLLSDPHLRAFCADHGVDVLSTPLWELEFAAIDRNVTVDASEPWEATLTVTYDDETLEIVVDEDLSVIERTHR
ncbi:DUF7351 domain-containing protein [Natronomonas sp.]|uniref:DUF7351 domain-containing protein n=1 Tax=Natronomonas sp. TaxID=2184060 RepID=UPI002FC37574